MKVGVIGCFRSVTYSVSWAAWTRACHPREIYERIREENLRAGRVGNSEVGALGERLRAIFPGSATSKKPSTE